MDRKIIVFSGMPASGKDTLSDYLCKQFKKLVPFKKHRSVSDDTILKNTYFNVSTNEFLKLANNGEFLQYHMRYNRYYGISKHVLEEYFSNNLIPIVHIGRIENYYSLLNNIDKNTKIIHVQLWETIEELSARIRKREKDPQETQKRITAMLQEFADSIEMMNRNERPFTLVIRNSNLEKSAQVILSLLSNDQAQDDGYNEFWTYLKCIQEEGSWNNSFL